MNIVICDVCGKEVYKSTTNGPEIHAPNRMSIHVNYRGIDWNDVDYEERNKNLIVCEDCMEKVEKLLHFKGDKTILSQGNDGVSSYF